MPLLILDLETTGLPPKPYPPPFEYYKYNQCRIVQFTYAYYNNTTRHLLCDYIIHPHDVFRIENSDIHGITQERAEKEGSDLSFVLLQFYSVLQSIDTIVGHNIEFDLNVIKSECYRLQMYHIVEELEKKKYICTMKSTVKLCKIPTPYGYKYPKLSELYEYLYSKKPDNLHNSKYDVLYTADCYFRLREIKFHFEFSFI